MSDDDVRDVVRASGADAPPAFRAAMKAELTAALRGDQPKRVVSAPTTNGRTPWLAAAAAVVVLLAGGATVLLVRRGDDSTLTPVPDTGTVEVTTSTASSALPSVPETTAPAPTDPASSAPSTTPVTTSPGTVPSPVPPAPDPDIPLLSVDARWPLAVLGAELASGSSPSDPSALQWASFTADRWMVVQQAAPDGPLVVTLIALDGMQQWAVPVPLTYQGARQTGGMEIGPRDVLYAYYEGSDGALTAAIATSGDRRGQVIANWQSDPSCYETRCGPAMGEDGVLVGGGTSPYVDQAGAPIQGTFQYPERGGHDDRLGPAMPSDWPTDDGQGGTLLSNRTTFSAGGRSWTFDAVGVPSAIYDFDYLGRTVFADGSALVWFTTYDGAGSRATRSKQFLGVLFADGRSSFVELPKGVVDVTGHAGQVYVTTYDESTRAYALHLLNLG